MPLPLVPIAAGIAIRAVLKKIGTTAVKKGAKAVVKTKPFRPARARSASEQTAYLETLQATKQLRFAKQAIRRSKKKIADTKSIVKSAKKANDTSRANTTAERAALTGAATAGLVGTGAVLEKNRRKKK